MEFKGTKGEWKVYKTYDEMDTQQLSVISKDGIISHCYNLQLCCGKQEKAEANAKLIASAPDLLEALQEIQIDLSILKSNFIQIEKTDSRAEGMTDIIDKWIERNKKAIEKALL